MSQVEVSLSRRALARVNRLLVGGAVAVGITVAANALIYGIARAVGLTFTIPYQGPDIPAAPLPLAMVTIVSAASAIAGTLLLAGLGRVTDRAVGIFQAIAAIVLLLSLIGPLSMPIDAATRATLVAMHVVAAASIVTVLTKYSVSE